MSDYTQEKILKHLHWFWPNHTIEVFRWEHGPVLELVDTFRVGRISPRSADEPWIYISLNASELRGAHDSTEFVILSPIEDMIHIETLAVTAFYNVSYPLTLGKVIDVGKPWLQNSRMHHFLVSLPYPYGPAFEWCTLSDTEKVRFLWLLPVTEEEADFAKAYGVEALERRFDQEEINAVDPERQSVTAN